MVAMVGVDDDSGGIVGILALVVDTKGWWSALTVIFDFFVVRMFAVWWSTREWWWQWCGGGCVRAGVYDERMGVCMCVREWV